MSKDNNKEMHPASFRPFMREDVQLIIEPAASFTDEVNPLSAMHEKFSRFNFAVINKGISATMNMRFFSDTPEDANSYIEFRELAKLAKEMHIKAKYAPKKAVSPAFTLVFKSGRDTKGKTAAQVLKENPNGRDILSSQRDFLQQNVGKYSSNQLYIDAIDEALTLSQEQIDNTENSIELVLFESGLRSNSYKTNSNGKVLCYSGKITFYPGADSPLAVSVENYYAKTEKTNKGLDKILTDTAEDKKSGTINLNFGEALRLFEELEMYYTIKSKELTQKGIQESEKMLAESRKKSKSESDKNEAESSTQPVTDTTTTTATAEIYTESTFVKEDSGSYACCFKGKMKDGTKGKTIYKLIMDKDKFIGNGDDFNLLFKNAASESTLVNVMYEKGQIDGKDVFYLIDIINTVTEE